ncbi:MAG: glucokinase, partial [Thermoanaerobaculia bacterium]
DLLGDDEVVTLQAGTPEPTGNRALIAAGTGLGMALLPRVGERWVPVPSEGGHMDFAPRTEEEIGLLRYLRERYGRVSVERVVTGPGLFNLYSYLRDTYQIPENPQVREALAKGTDPARVIGEAALAGPGAGCEICSRAMDLFVAAYGAAAGNLALVGTATGGVYLGGGIAPKILPRLQGGLFLQTFEAKGRFVPYLERMPVRVILNDKAALLGAAWLAMERLEAAELPASPPG